MDFKRYLAILRQQQARMEAMANVKGTLPLQRVYNDLIASITKGSSGGGKMDFQRQSELMRRVRTAMMQFVRSGTDVINTAAEHIVSVTAGQSFDLMVTLEKQLTGRTLRVSDRSRDAIVSAGPKPSTLIGAHQRSLSRYGAHVITKIDEQVTAGIVRGESHAEVVDRVMETADMEFWRAERIVKTELSYAGNSASRAAIGKEHEILGDVFSQWTENADEDGRPLDDIVCVDSLAIHGQIAGPGQVFIMPPTSVFPDSTGQTIVPAKLVGQTWAHPPNRPNDRSVIGPWRPHWPTPGWRWEDEARIDKRRPLEERDPGEAETEVPDEEQVASARRVQEMSATALAKTQGEGTRGLGGGRRPPPSSPPVPGAAPRRRSDDGSSGAAAAVAPAVPRSAPAGRRPPPATRVPVPVPPPPPPLPGSSSVTTPRPASAPIENLDDLVKIKAEHARPFETTMPHAVDADLPEKVRQAFERRMLRAVGQAVTLAEIASAHRPPPGYRAEIADLPTDSTGAANININYYDEETDELAARVERSFADGHADHRRLDVSPGHRESDFGPALNGPSILRRYQKWGVKTVTRDPKYASANRNQPVSFQSADQLIAAGDALIDKRVNAADRAARKLAFREMVAHRGSSWWRRVDSLDDLWDMIRALLPKRNAPPMKQVERIDEVAPVTLATFAMVKDRVVAMWHDERYQRSIERSGIDSTYGRVRPDDGQAFFDALDDAYSEAWPLRVVAVGAGTGG